ncbi:M48 family metallopeptidase [Streptosporangium sp. NPDC002721]|uniref:M48 family metallopeptidase n=1 Tax=Streptosporangium sp. NPDC002721 TaxID=3366188 RepID=UPI0036BAA777
MSQFPGTLRVDDLDVTVEISPRRESVRLTVERDASVTATVPPLVGPEELARIVRSRRRWLYAKLAEHATLGPARPPHAYLSGEGFLYLGRSHRLLLVDDAPVAVRLLRGRLELRRDCLDDPAGHIVRWYRQVGEPWLLKRVAPWAEVLGVTVAGLRVLPLGYRWGSCSLSGHVNIHWAAMQLPPDLIDYVLVHELAHLRRPDHSPEFWRIVERALPGHRENRERLRRLGPGLWLP